MASVLQIATWRPNVGRVQELMANMAKAKEIHERLGAKVQVRATQYGGTPLSIVYSIEHTDWAAFGSFSEEMSSDSDWLKLWATTTAGPPGELITNTISTELAM